MRVVKQVDLRRHTRCEMANLIAMNSTHLHQNNSHTSSTSKWKRFATAAAATAALGILPAGAAAAGAAAATASAQTPAVATHDIPRDHDTTMQQQRRHDRQRDQRQERRAETTIGSQIHWSTSNTPM